MPRYLLADETELVTVRRHWILLARSLAVPLAILVLALALNVVVPLPADLRLAVILFALALAGLWLIVAWVRWAATSLTVTDKRVLLETGILNRSSKVIPLTRIQDVSTRASLLGRLLGYGTIEIDAAGPGGSEVLDHVPGPDLVRDHVFVVAERQRRTAAT